MPLLLLLLTAAAQAACEAVQATHTSTQIAVTDSCCLLLRLLARLALNHQQVPAQLKVLQLAAGQVLHPQHLPVTSRPPTDTLTCHYHSPLSR